MNKLCKIAEKVLNCEELKREELEYLFLSKDEELDDLLYWANKIRKKFKGDSVKLCSIINAKSGMCSEDCRFCAQSAHSRAEVKSYPLVSPSEIYGAYERAARSGALCFGVVTSGRGVSDEDVARVGEAIKKISSDADTAQKEYTGDASRPLVRAKISASLGELTIEQLAFLKECGLKKYHHNIETSERFFPSVCATHTYADRIKTLRAVKSAGLELCCGGLFGLGETPRDRLDFALTLKKINPDSVPLNFLNPVVGTALENAPPLSAREILGLIAAFRFILPDKDISVCGGREVNLRDLQSWIFFAGANGMMTGGYLTTPGRSSDEDKKMLADLGLEVAQ
ncbi:MAG: biotin synthase BioB [Endomicrobiia bacterium]|nr:biotin synthase BioB [Endomicrobiia bacterium]